MIPEQRKLFLLAQRPNGAPGNCRTRKVVETHVQSPLGSPRGGVESLDHSYCALQHGIQGHFQPQVTPLANRAAIAAQRTIWVWVTIATSFPSSVSSRVC